MTDIVNTQTRAILDAIAPQEWWHTHDPSVVVVSLDGTTAIRLAVTAALLPEESPYDTGENLYLSEESASVPLTQFEQNFLRNMRHWIADAGFATDIRNTLAGIVAKLPESDA